MYNRDLHKEVVLMTKTVIAVYDDFDKAYRVVDALQKSGFTRADISVIANDADGVYADNLRRGELINDDDVNAAEGAGFGALVGALTGLVIGLGALAIPGLGPVIAAGPIVSALAGTTVGAAAGAATGGIVAALVDLGVDEDDAGLYAEGIRRGGTMVAVKTRDDTAETAAGIMRSGQPIDVDASAERWREQGWQKYIEGDAPYEAQHIQRSRDLYVPMGTEAHVIRLYGFNFED
jgi:uncharacterized membrane protein